MKEFCHNFQSNLARFTLQGSILLFYSQIIYPRLSPSLLTLEYL
jgi:hypothetical protein